MLDTMQATICNSCYARQIWGVHAQQACLLLSLKALESSGTPRIHMQVWSCQTSCFFTMHMKDRVLKHLGSKIDDTNVQIISHNIWQDHCIALHHSGLGPYGHPSLDTAGDTPLPARTCGGEPSLWLTPCPDSSFCLATYKKIHSGQSQLIFPFLIWYGLSVSVMQIIFSHNAVLCQTTAKCLDCGILKMAYLARTQSHAHEHHTYQTS